jgi:hypothetical protein
VSAFSTIRLAYTARILVLLCVSVPSFLINLDANIPRLVAVHLAHRLSGCALLTAGLLLVAAA